MSQDFLLNAASRTDSDGPDDPYESLARALKFAGRKWFMLLGENMASVGQTSLRWMALSRISDRAGGICQKELSHRLAIDEPSMARIVKALEEQGLIERSAAAPDRRQKILSLTPAAAAPLQEGQRIGREMKAEIIRGIPEADLMVAERVLLQICVGLDRVEARRKPSDRRPQLEIGLYADELTTAG